MANKNFTDFILKYPASGDFLVGYNADGSAEYKTTVNALVSSYATNTVLNTVSSTLLPTSVYSSTSGSFATNTALNAASGILLPTSVYSSTSGSFATRSFTDSKYLPLSTTSVVYTNLTATNAFIRNLTATNLTSVLFIGTSAVNPSGVKTVYLAPRTDGREGTGTELDPYDVGGSTPEIAAFKYDEVISNWGYSLNDITKLGTIATATINSNDTKSHNIKVGDEIKIYGVYENSKAWNDTPFIVTQVIESPQRQIVFTVPSTLPSPTKYTSQYFLYHKDNKCLPYCTIRLLPGKYYTKGCQGYNPAAQGSSASYRTFYPPNANLIGAGIDVTTIQKIGPTVFGNNINVLSIEKTSTPSSHAPVRPNYVEANIKTERPDSGFYVGRAIYLSGIDQTDWNEKSYLIIQANFNTRIQSITRVGTLATITTVQNLNNVNQGDIIQLANISENQWTSQFYTIQSITGLNQFTITVPSNYPSSGTGSLMSFYSNAAKIEVSNDLSNTVTGTIKAGVDSATAVISLWGLGHYVPAQDKFICERSGATQICSNLTIDGNGYNIKTKRIAQIGVAVGGGSFVPTVDNGIVEKVRCTNFVGDLTSGTETFVIAPLGNLMAICEKCVFDNPVAGWDDASPYISAIVPSGLKQIAVYFPDGSLLGYTYKAIGVSIARDCIIIGKERDGKFVHGVLNGTGLLDIVEGCYFDGCQNGCYTDTGFGVNSTIKNNYFADVRCSVHANITEEIHPTSKLDKPIHYVEQITILNNYIEVHPIPNIPLNDQPYNRAIRLRNCENVVIKNNRVVFTDGLPMHGQGSVFEVGRCNTLICKENILPHNSYALVLDNCQIIDCDKNFDQNGNEVYTMGNQYMNTIHVYGSHQDSSFQLNMLSATNTENGVVVLARFRYNGTGYDLQNGSLIEINNAPDSRYNGSFRAFNINNYNPYTQITFQYKINKNIEVPSVFNAGDNTTNFNGAYVTIKTGEIENGKELTKAIDRVGAGLNAYSVNDNSDARITISSISLTDNIATVVTTTNHNFANKQSIMIKNTSNTNYNNTIFQILSALDNTQFTIKLRKRDFETASSGGYVIPVFIQNVQTQPTIYVYPGTYKIASYFPQTFYVSCSGNSTTNTVFLSNHGFSDSDLVNFKDITYPCPTNFYSTYTYRISNVTPDTFTLLRTPDSGGWSLINFQIDKNFTAKVAKVNSTSLPYINKNFKLVGVTDDANSIVIKNADSTPGPQSLFVFHKPQMDVSISNVTLKSETTNPYASGSFASTINFGNAKEESSFLFKNVIFDTNYSTEYNSEWIGVYENCIFKKPFQYSQTRLLGTANNCKFPQGYFYEIGLTNTNYLSCFLRSCEGINNNITINSTTTFDNCIFNNSNSGLNNFYVVNNLITKNCTFNNTLIRLDGDYNEKFINCYFNFEPNQSTTLFSRSGAGNRIITTANCSTNAETLTSSNISINQITKF